MIITLPSGCRFLDNPTIKIPAPILGDLAVIRSGVSPGLGHLSWALELP